MTRIEKGGKAEIGKGEGYKTLSPLEINNKIFSGLPEKILKDKKVLILCEDFTRATPIDKFFPDLKKRLEAQGVSEITVLFAVGTHAKMSDADQLRKLGLTKETAEGLRFLNHDSKTEDLIEVGGLEGHKLRINKEVENADTIITLNNCLPHKIPGFTGGSKMIFPGIADEEFIAYFHGQKQAKENITDDQVVGQINNPIRDLIDRATDKMQEYFPDKKFISVSLVTAPEGGVIEVFAGTFRETYQQAAKLSKEIYVKEIEEPLDMIVAKIDDHKNTLWQGMQAVYNSAGVLKVDERGEGGGTIVISGTLAQIESDAHYKEILQFGGYAKVEELERRMIEGRKISPTVYEHMLRVGRFLSRGINIIISSQNFSEAQCKAMGLGYMAPDQVDLEYPDVIVHHATDTLLLQKQITA